MEKVAKTMKNGDIRQISFDLENQWEGLKSQIKVSGKSLYAIISIKKTLSEIGRTVAEAFFTVGQNAGGSDNGDGSMKIPDDKIDEVNTALTEIANTQTDIEYIPIILGENDSVPVEIMDLLFDFISID